MAGTSGVSLKAAGSIAARTQSWKAVALSESYKEVKVRGRLGNDAKIIEARTELFEYPSHRQTDKQSSHYKRKDSTQHKENWIQNDSDCVTKK